MSKIAHNQLTKLYYSIGEVANMLEVNTSLIRFWEKEFPIIKPKKNKKGNRLYTTKEIAKIDRIYILVKENGYTLDGARKALKSGAKIESSTVNPSSNGHLHEDLISRLEAVKSKLIALKNRT
ncbi:MAG: MerR family transcriptional regulator [Crocinitomicaceae bacterium]|nr:MerR family transcriptional regulator [Crocinitomicaceae bacterium]